MHTNQHNFLLGFSNIVYIYVFRAEREGLLKNEKICFLPLLDHPTLDQNFPFLSFFLSYANEINIVDKQTVY